MSEKKGLPEHLKKQIEELNPTQEHMLKIIVYLGAEVGAAYVHGGVPEERWMEVENVHHAMETAFISKEYADMAAKMRQDFIREQRGETLADVVDIAEAIKRCGKSCSKKGKDDVDAD